MKIIEAGFEFPYGRVMASSVYKKLELAGRTCYKSDSIKYEVRPSTEPRTDETGSVYMEEIYDLYANDTKIESFTSLDEAANTKIRMEFECAEKFVRKLIERGHEAMLEHVSLTVKFIVDRGVSHELVRHRLASFAQESTRYCNYSKDKFGHEITVIEPVFFKDIDENRRKYLINQFQYVGNDPLLSNLTDHERAYAGWVYGCTTAETAYFGMLDDGCTPQEARSVLPNSLKTEVIMTANLREWRHFLKLRAAGVSGKPHPQMLEVAIPLLNELRERLPAIFDDIEPMQEKNDGQ